MPRIRMRTTAAGPSGCFVAGQVYTVSDAEAELLVAARAAERLADAPERTGPTSVRRVQIETAAIDASEEDAAERTWRTRRARG